MPPTLDLQHAVELKDDDALADALQPLFDQPPSPAATASLCALLLADWHQQHEDIALLLQAHKDPSAAQALASAATIPFEHLLHWNNLSEFQRKCTWALADIGTEQAQTLLTGLAHGDDPGLAAFAQRRLERWALELDRKGHRA